MPKPPTGRDVDRHTFMKDGILGAAICSGFVGEFTIRQFHSRWLSIIGDQNERTSRRLLKATVELGMTEERRVEKVLFYRWLGWPEPIQH
jgi:hypothetical protein